MNENGMQSHKKYFNSGDFDKTPTTPKVVFPEKLIHTAIEAADTSNAYSEERKHPVFVVKLPSHCISMTIGWLEPGQHSNLHRHTYETLLYILEGEGYSSIQGKKIEWKMGDALYIPVWVWHNHYNVSGKNKARYLACENAPLLQNMGGIALREEKSESSGEDHIVETYEFNQTRVS